MSELLPTFPPAFQEESQSDTGASPETAAETATESREPVPEEERPSVNPFASLAPFLIIGVIFWVLILGPERKNRRKLAETLANLKKNDEVMTKGGIYGRVTRLDGDVITLQVADGVRMRFNRSAIQGLVGEAEGADEKAEKADEPQAGSKTV